jgi:hypothetical protein
MTHKAITLKFVVLTMLAIALGILISIGATDWTGKHPVATDQHSVASSRGFAELQKPDGRFSRLNLLLSRGY